MENKGCKPPKKNTKTSNQPPKLGRDIEGRYAESRGQTAQLQDLVAVLDENATNIFEGVEKSIKVEYKINNTKQQVDSDHTIDDTTNDDRESNLPKCKC